MQAQPKKRGGARQVAAAISGATTVADGVPQHVPIAKKKAAAPPSSLPLNKRPRGAGVEADTGAAGDETARARAKRSTPLSHE